jgi:hypothetical protein
LTEKSENADLNAKEKIAEDVLQLDAYDAAVLITNLSEQ